MLLKIPQLSLVSICLLLSLNLAHADPAEQCDTVCQFEQTIEQNANIVGEIWALNRQDRHERNRAIALITSPNVENAKRSELGERLFDIIEKRDIERTKRLKEILRSYTWEDLYRIDDDLPNRAWLIAQHASHDIEFQRDVLASITPLVQAGQMDSDGFALMTDEIELASDGVQIYGSQYECEGGEYVAKNILDPDKVDERRAELNLEPLSVYLLNAAEYNGECQAN